MLFRVCFRVFLPSVSPAQIVLSCGYDFVVTPLGRPGRTGHASWPPAPLPVSAFPAAPGRDVAWTRSDRDLAGAQWSGQVVGTLSRWADPDSADASLAADSLAAWAREAAWASHLGLQAIVADLGALWRVREARGEAPWRGPGGHPRTLRALADVLEAAPGAALWVLVPLQDVASAPRAAPTGPDAADASWAFFDALRTFCDHSSRLGVALSVGAGWERVRLGGRSDGASVVPAASASPSAASLARWRGEPLKALFVESTAFTKNKKGFPVLPKPLAAVVTAAVSDGVQVVVREARLARPFGSSKKKDKEIETSGKDDAGKHGRTGNARAGGDAASGGTAGTMARTSASASTSVTKALPTASPSAPPPSSASPSSSSPACSVPDLSLFFPGSPTSTAHAHWEYASYLFRRAPAPSTPAGAPCDGEDPDPQYRDLLQAPLQPLADDLESGTYETFERDRIKYQLYEEAIELVLRDRLQLGLHRATDGTNGKAAAADGSGAQQRSTDGCGATADTETAAPVVPVSASPKAAAVRVAVCGAGRGPLVAAALRAADRVGVPVRVEVVEKNANALVTLAHRLRDPDESPRWLGRVRLTPGDMRSWVPIEGPGSVDVLVSELLGSFGDNELSPECLDGPARWLEPAHGVSIPSRSASYLAPVTASGPWTDARAASAEDAGKSPLDTPYVVQLHRARELAEPQQVFVFYHGKQGRITQGKETQQGENDANAGKQQEEKEEKRETGGAVGAEKETPANKRTNQRTESQRGGDQGNALGNADCLPLFAAYPPPPLALPARAEVPAGLVSSDSNDRHATLDFAPTPAAPPVWSPAWAAAAQAAPGAAPSAAALCTAEPTSAQALQPAPSCVVHGFVGYFDATLYGSIQLSTLPATHTPGMHSWFPIFFPLREPVRADRGQRVALAMWRRGDARKVWYEWGLVQPRVTLLQNLRGKNYHVGLL